MTDHSELIAKLNDGVRWAGESKGVKTFHIKEADATMKAAAEAIAALEAAIKRQSGAARTIQATTAMVAQNENERLRRIDRSEYNAAATVDSEREANSRLTEELDAANARAEKAEADLAAWKANAEALANATTTLLDDMKELADSGDCGFWEAEATDVYKQGASAHAAHDKLKGEEA